MAFWLSASVFLQVNVSEWNQYDIEQTEFNSVSE